METRETQYSYYISPPLTPSSAKTQAPIESMQNQAQQSLEDSDFETAEMIVNQLLKIIKIQEKV
ncbi:MAG: hypothetical protein A3I75_02935 [Deltaproteobacteria bacterium RIFCSPLOWO2_02_FULL_50_16]|nr:MAG: hypothetical protein A2053_05400 [Deltaproteobacteria bacterium GWA2_50_8]OGQ26402.1 MAG: hypothetical protein A3B79_06875 [Deltaproteobacteria bacterium RIFCSPHIGHO2_02_FULL_50_15]OGQ56902.1 MAG: hypothetical protein A3I75_02935 [Deltaproteobacteria bacterium RIFCSPLOWO2_02_FULL_50_16]OGQ67920.1 MAG: hypothetical protein A3F89_03305 [Deltaproteobacteria bacterium RIFCSPLOWO2_12_FULL_50_11]